MGEWIRKNSLIFSDKLDILIHMNSEQLYPLLIAEIKEISAEIHRLEEKRRQLQATARLYEPKSASNEAIPPIQPPIDMEEEFRPGSLKHRILHHLGNNGPRTVPQIQKSLNVTHMPSVFRAVGQLKEMGLAFIDDEKRVHIKG
jgi:hypothetical protein